MIYLYSKEKKEVKITINKVDIIIQSYPEYMNGWTVNTLDGCYNILDVESDKKLSALYYDTLLLEIPRNFITHGYNVERDDILEFLDSKLKTLGLNHYERNQFIVNWVKVLMENDYTHIYFETDQEVISRITTGIEVVPKPDKLYQIRLLFEPCDRDDTYTEQKLDMLDRSGFTVIDINANTVDIKGIH